MEFFDNEDKTRGMLEKVLVRLVTQVSNSTMRESQMSEFIGAKAPQIPIEDYMHRLFKYTYCSNSAIIHLIILLNRLLEKYHFVLNCATVHRTIFILLVTSIKMTDDDELTTINGEIFTVNKCSFAQCGGVTIDEFKLLERTLCKIMDFDFMVTSQEYETFNMLIFDFYLGMIAKRVTSEAEKEEEERAIIDSIHIEENATHEEIDLFCSESIPGLC